MKRKLLFLTTAMAVGLLSACNTNDASTQYADRDTAICIDRVTHKRVPDNQCGQTTVVNNNAGAGNAFLWYYLGRTSVIPYYGDRITPGVGSYTRTSGATYFHAPASTSMTRSVAISRGGFGASSSAHGFSSAGE